MAPGESSSEIWYARDFNFASMFNSLVVNLSSGPVIRINPDEVHIHDADYFDCIYTNSIGRVNKSDKLVGAFGPFHAVRLSTPTEGSRKQSNEILFRWSEPSIMSYITFAKRQ